MIERPGSIWEPQRRAAGLCGKGERVCAPHLWSDGHSTWPLALRSRPGLTVPPSPRAESPGPGLQADMASARSPLVGLSLQDLPRTPGRRSGFPSGS